MKISGLLLCVSALAVAACSNDDGGGTPDLLPMAGSVSPGLGGAGVMTAPPAPSMMGTVPPSAGAGVGTAGAVAPPTTMAGNGDVMMAGAGGGAAGGAAP